MALDPRTLQDARSRRPERAHRRATLAWLVLWPALAAAADTALQDEEPLAPLPISTPADPARAALGARLFNDTRLSRDNTQSCASCHPLDRGGVDGFARAPSASVVKILRNTPTVFNVSLNLSFNWDGSARSLEAQANGVIQSPAQFNNTWPKVLDTLRADSAYVAGFKAAYREGLTQDNVLEALASYQRNLNTPNARFDKYLRGQRDAISASELEGYALFKSFGCVACHQGMNVGGNLYQKFGVFRDTKPGRRADEAPDLGRFWVTHDERDRETFRVPSLRNVELTPPYFHDGRAATLDDAVRTMARVQLDRTLSPHETDAIVQFLRTLTGELEGRPLSASAPGATQEVRQK
jgi:cytochrome c peroxidase